MKKIGIIGAGFSGTMTAVQLIKKSIEPLDIILFDKLENFNKGIAYSPYSKKHLLNVPCAKMSAFPKYPNHFLDWILKRPEFADKDKAFIADTFLPRAHYGEYLVSIWNEAQSEAQEKGIKIYTNYSLVKALIPVLDSIQLSLENGNEILVDQCVIATGNQLPRNPKIKNMGFYKSKNYFQNPWKEDAVKDIYSKLPVFIIGNGLTMVDTVLSLLEKGYKGQIYALSPNGFNILPHRHSGLKYKHLANEINPELPLKELFSLVKHHIQNVRKYGISAEPVIDSMRPFTQSFWQSFSQQEKELFMRRFRHLWGVARHRIPTNSHDKIQQLRIDGKLRIIAGNLIDINEYDGHITVDYVNKKLNMLESIGVSRVINCTGPESDIQKMNSDFLKYCLQNEVLSQDDLKLGINADTNTFQVRAATGGLHTNIYTMGSNLRGELWESTAINELRVQAERLATQILSNSKIAR